MHSCSILPLEEANIYILQVTQRKKFNVVSAYLSLLGPIFELVSRPWGLRGGNF